MRERPELAFWHVLSGHLGRSVTELQRTMGAREFYQWLAYDRIEPLGARGERFQLAQLTSIVTNMMRGKGRAYQLHEFVPWWRAPVQKAAALWAQFTAIVKRHNEKFRGQ